LTVRAILWDFGDTLADERWMRAPMPEAPRWPELYARFSESELAERWNIGAVGIDEIAAHFAEQLGIEAARVRAHMEACSRAIIFFPLVHELTQRRALPQAIVTVNPDIFSLVVVPAYALSSQFEAIVTSWQTGSLDKAELCDRAIAMLNPQFRRDECLLIDNREDAVARWTDKGGAAFHFQGERDLHDRFAEFVRGG